MTDEYDSLEIIKILISTDFNFGDITDEELYKIITEECNIDLTFFDLSSIEDDKEEIIESLEILKDTKKARKKLEALFISIKDKGFEIESFLNYVDYNEDNFDISILTLDQLNYMEEQIDSLLSEVEEKSKLERLEEDLAILEKAKETNDPNFFDDLLNDNINIQNANDEIERLKKEIEALKLKTIEKEHKYTLEELQIVQAKDFLSTSDLAILYDNFSINRQVTYRGRIHDPLPFQQLKKGNKIIYARKEVDIWKINNNK